MIEPAMSKTTDPVNPNHYNGTECLEAIAKATANLKGKEAFCTGNAIKYLWRWKHKNGVEDLKKAQRYIDMLILNVEGEVNG